MNVSISTVESHSQCVLTNHARSAACIMATEVLVLSRSLLPCLHLTLLIISFSVRDSDSVRIHEGNKRNIVKRNHMKARQVRKRQYKNLCSHNISRWFGESGQHSLRIGFHSADQGIPSLQIILLAVIIKSSWCLVPQPRNHNSRQGRVRVTDTPKSRQ